MLPWSARGSAAPAKIESIRNKLLHCSTLLATTEGNKYFKLQNIKKELFTVLCYYVMFSTSVHLSICPCFCLISCAVFFLHTINNSFPYLGVEDQTLGLLQLFPLQLLPLALTVGQVHRRHRQVLEVLGGGEEERRGGGEEGRAPVHPHAESRRTRRWSQGWAGLD